MRRQFSTSSGSTAGQASLLQTFRCASAPHTCPAYAWASTLQLRLRFMRSSVPHCISRIVADGQSWHVSESCCCPAALSCRVPLRSSLLAATLGLGTFGRPAAAASFASYAAIIDQVTFKEMGLLSWLLVDVAIQWGGWAVSALLKVGGLQCCVHFRTATSSAMNAEQQGQLVWRSNVQAAVMLCPL